MSDNSQTKNYRTYNPDNFNLVPMLCVGTEPSRLRSSSFALCTFVPTKVPKTPDKNYWRELHYID